MAAGGGRGAARIECRRSLFIAIAEADARSAFVDIAPGWDIVREHVADCGAGGAFAGWNAAGIYCSRRQGQIPSVCEATELPDGAASERNRRRHVSILVSGRP